MITKHIKFKIFSEGPRKAIDEIIKMLKNKKKGYSCFIPVHGFSLSLIDKEIERAYIYSTINFPDGKPVALYSSFFYKNNTSQVCGPDFMKSLLHRLDKLKKKKVFLLGGDNQTKSVFIKKFREDFPCINIVGFSTRKIGEKKDYNLIKLINSKNPDIVLVGVGCPKQEKWMLNNTDEINSFLFGIGAAFSFYIGKEKRAPKWIQKIYLEWFYRFCSDPRRLFIRYFKFNIIFLIHVSLLFLGKIFKLILK